MGVLTDEEKADFDKVQEAFYNSDDLFTQYEVRSTSVARSIPIHITRVYRRVTQS